jgi:hypothetical protein
MGEQVARQRKTKAPANALPAVEQQNAAPETQNTKTPPPFQMKAEPIQRQADAGVTKTPEEIAAKKAQMEADATVIGPGEDFVATDPTVVNAALDRAGYKTIPKMDESTNLCGVNIAGGINPLAVPKIQKVNTAFQALQNSPDPAVKAQADEITKMIQKIGGSVFRVQKKNFTDLDKWLAPYGLYGYRRVKLSDHALGVAVDVNANTKTLQNAHFEGNTARGKKNDIMEFVQKVVKLNDPTFDLEETTGVDHMLRINKFSDYFPAYFEDLMSKYNTDGKITDYWTEEAATLKLLKKHKANKEIKLILANWEIFKGWANGTNSKKFKEGEDSKVNTDASQVNYGEAGRLHLKGIVDINQTFLQMMLDAGWTWGGDFDRGNKDYMHFEDHDARTAMKK